MRAEYPLFLLRKLWYPELDTNMTNVEILQEVGLTAAESKIYVALLRLGTAKASQVIRETGLRNSVVHLTLTRLIENGFVTFVRRGNVRFFQATHPKTFSRIIDEKKEKLTVLLPELLALYQPFERQAAEVFEGLNGFHSMLYQLIEDGKKGDEFLFFAFYHPDPSVQKEVYPLYATYERERLNRGFKLKGIVPESVRPHFASRRQEHLLFVKFPILLNINIFRNKVALTPWGERKISFLLTSSELAQHFTHYFYSIWNQKL
jgi:sugar-specific transcriptional regulator TrmB